MPGADPEGVQGQWRRQGGQGGELPPWKNLGGNFESEHMVKLAHDVVKF